MTMYLVAVNLLIEAGPEQRAPISATLYEILSERRRGKVGSDSSLIDWVVAGDDLAASISTADLAMPYVPGETPFPSWPAAPALPRSGRRPSA